MTDIENCSVNGKKNDLAVRIVYTRWKTLVFLLLQTIAVLLKIPRW